MGLKTALLKYNHRLDILFTSDTALDSSWEEICCCGKPLEIIWDCLLPLIYLASTSTGRFSIVHCPGGGMSSESNKNTSQFLS